MDLRNTETNENTECTEGIVLVQSFELDIFSVFSVVNCIFLLGRAFGEAFN